ncbi:putative tRNA dimethylallyltransferase [Rosa chinensis]|uniref:Putative tRNA dimethylallyltransferase n=1 Tax=Rosa chinensis TaxID=74649 RepID=A0A2P6QFQ1_ROSCH|nr:putative tRNA dimethylallyltransferase [Rosa chinensis]
MYYSSDYSVGQFYDDARQATRCILDNGRVPIVTGVTGLYLRCLFRLNSDTLWNLEGCCYLYLERNGHWDAAVQLVIKASNPKAQFLAANDWYRLRRSLEIIKSSRSAPSAFEVPYDSFRKECDSSVVDTNDISSSADVVEEVKSKELDYDFICFFLSNQRVDLYRSIDWQCEDMVSGTDGILSEARWLLDAGLIPNSNSATRAIGYGVFVSV